MSFLGLRLRQWFAIALVAGLMLLCSAFWSISTIRDGLRCETASQLCYYQSHYLWMSHNVAAFRFSDVKEVRTVFLGQGKDGKHYGMLLHLGQLPSVMVRRPSSYMANKEVSKLKAYLVTPKTDSFELPSVFSWAGLFLMLLPLGVGLMSCQSMYQTILKANQKAITETGDVSQIEA